MGILAAQFIFSGDGNAPAGTVLEFSVKNIRNPGTSEPVVAIGVQLLDKNSNQIGTFTGDMPYIKATTAATILTKELILSDSSPLATTMATISYRSVNILPRTTTFQVSYPSQAEFPPGNPTCKTVIEGVTYNNLCHIDTN
jgi:hypothetical protein